ncbi:MAG: glycoside hydrolase family 113 [Myxococcota bacterium]
MSRAAVVVSGALLALSAGVLLAVGTGVGGGPRHDAANGPDLEPWGLAVGMYPAEAARRGFPFPPDLGEVAALGARSVLVPISLVQDDLHAATVGRGERTPSDARIAEVVAEARAHGLGVALLPMLELREGPPHAWRGRIRPRDPVTWWRTYEQEVLRYATLAEALGAAMYVVGSELTSMTDGAQADRWRRLVRRVRLRYGGRLAYVANHDALDRTAPFDAVDVVGVSAYFPLAGSPDPSAAELGGAWARAAARLRSLGKRHGKPVVLFEVGYPSVDGAAMRPWDYTSGRPIDLEEQRAAYAAAVDTILRSPWISGAFFWTWFGPGGPHCRYYTPRDKPAEVELRRLFRGIGAADGGVP